MSYGNCGSYGHRGYYCPPNTVDNQFLTKNGCFRYSSLNFDEPLAMGKINRQEVDGMLH